MTVKSNVVNLDGKQLTLYEVAQRSRSALRTTRTASGVLIDPPSIDGQIVDDLIPLSVLDPGPLIIRFQTSKIPVPHDDDEYILYYRDSTGAETPIKSDKFGPANPRPPELEIEVDTTSLVDDDLTRGSTAYEYQFVLIPGATGNEDPSPWFKAEIDRFAPEHDKATGIRLNPESAVLLNLPTGTIDDDWLDNNTALELEVFTGYPFWRPDDKIEIYMETAYGTGTPIHSQDLTVGTISIPKDKLPELDGSYYIWYVLTDVVGNISDDSNPTRISVVRLPPPGLFECVIPKGILPDAIDLEDIETPVYITVDRATNGQDDDRVVMNIGHSGAGFDLGTQSLGSAPMLQFVATKSRLLALWNQSSVPVNISATYQFIRGTDSPRSPTPTPSLLDFTYRGPENPDFPDRVNPHMTVVTVVDDDGNVNHITSKNRDKVATISTPMYDSTTTTWTALGDEKAKLWYRGNEIYSQDIPAGPVTGVLTYDMDPNSGFDFGVGNQTAFWTIEEDGGRNIIKSPPTTVTVDPVLVTMPPPTVRLFGAFVTCVSLKRYTWELTVTVPVDPAYMPVGTVVTVKSVGTDSADTTEVPGTQFSDTYRVTGLETNGVFTIDVKPYLEKLKPIQPPNGSGAPNGWIKIWYEVPGVPDPSVELFHEVRFLNPSFQYCEEAVPGP
ncbi:MULTISPECIES: hypothetical protein [unclassified Pseudomonas]|uniref:hypothetical protein n=1 Tax=unclassified Pseudomonas TaxID=196821 RepID=UPI0009121F09|nr:MULTISPECIES: hypothetical protein [unclassified Pseudomonas]SFY27645.1 hypothetical protein SAMN03159442_05073 [Pseudomonas sp. NFACC47-1]SFY42428.1 hypothetical protein SAMN03159352_05153 [Pseudomonas sp. NFACC43]